MWALLLLGCQEEAEVYEDFHSDLYEICLQSEEDCDLVLRGVFEDDEGIGLLGMKWLIFEASPWFTDMVVTNADTISTDCHTDRGAVAGYKPFRDKICIGDTQIMRTPIRAAGVLVHEAGHGRPPGRHTHTKCATPEYYGLRACDRDLKGAVGAELLYWENMTSMDDPFREFAKGKLGQTLQLILE